MNRRLRISAAAEHELYEIWRYIAEESGSAAIADRFVEEITGRYALLCRFGEIGRSREELGPGVRSFVVRNYILYYRIRDDVIEIAHVAHGSRLPDAIFNMSDKAE